LFNVNFFHEKRNRKRVDSGWNEGGKVRQVPLEELRSGLTTLTSATRNFASPATILFLYDALTMNLPSWTSPFTYSFLPA